MASFVLLQSTNMTTTTTAATAAMKMNVQLSKTLLNYSISYRHINLIINTYKHLFLTVM